MSARESRIKNRALLRAVLGFLFLTVASAAEAQSAYVGGSLVADVLRFSGSTTQTNPGNGEVMGGALRLGAPLGDRWGVDLEFARTGEIDTSPDVRILAQSIGSAILTSLADRSTGIAIFPPPVVRAEQQLSTLTTMLWWRYDVNERFDLLYLGGVAFTRMEREYRVDYPLVRVPLPPEFVRPPVVFEDESVEYDAGVAVGLDARIVMTEHLRLVPGVRLMTIGRGGWSVRPAVGLHWIF